MPHGWSYEKVFGAPGESAADAPAPDRVRLQQALALRPASPGELAQVGALAGARGSVALPQTATDARWRALVGGLALLGGLLLLALVRWGRRWGGRIAHRG